jgi:hypothetical protein
MIKHAANVPDRKVGSEFFDLRYARARLTTTLTTKRAHWGGKYGLWRTDYLRNRSALDAGGQLCLSRR